jgi:hypothetical protein
MMKKIAILSALALSAGLAQGTLLTYTPSFDAGQYTNTSAITAYDVDGANLGEGIVDGTPSFTDTYYFLDADTGIKFNVDFTFTVSGGNLGTGNGIGVDGGTYDWIDEGESVTISVFNLVVDTSGYIDNSISGLSGPVTVASSALGINEFSVASISAADPAFVSDGTTTDSVVATPYFFGTTLSTTTGEGILSFVAGVDGDTRVRLSEWQPYIEINVVPEPATLGLVAAFGGGILVIRHRFMI